MTAACVAAVTERFPEDAVLIRRRMIADQHFRGICDDYCVAVAALQHWEAAEAAESDVRRAEYRSLVESLEQEIREALGG